MSSNKELTGEPSRVLKGDAVGDTMYSERWIIKLLIRLTKFVAGDEEYNSDLESDLCTLWDMCAEKDVVILLRKHGMLSMVVNTILKSEEPRLNEIMIGIIGNMCAVKSVRKECEQRPDILKILMDLLSLPDGPTLIQVIRVLQTFAWDVNNSCQIMSAPRIIHEVGDPNQNDDQQNMDDFPDQYEQEEYVAEYVAENEAEYAVENMIENANGCNGISDESSLSDEVVIEDVAPVFEEPVSSPLDGSDDIQMNCNNVAVNCVMEDAGGLWVNHTFEEGLGNQGASSGSSYLISSNLGTQRTDSSDEVKASVSGMSLQYSQDTSESYRVSADEEEDAEVVDIGSDVETESFTTCGLWYQQFLDINSWLPEIIFILNSSKNVELLGATWSLLQTLCYIPVSDTYLFYNIVGSDVMRCLLESYKEYFSTYLNKDESELENMSHCRKGTVVWTSIVYSFTLHHDCIEILCKFKPDILRNVFQLLKFYHHFLPLDEDLLEYLFQAFAILDEISVTPPLETTCLHSGLHYSIYLLDHLTASKVSKQENYEDAHLEEEAIDSIERYLRNVLVWLTNSVDDKSTEVFSDVRVKLVEKFG